MKLSDISAHQRRYVVPAAGHPEVIALVPPALPRSIDLSKNMVPIETATFALGTFAPRASDLEQFPAHLDLLLCREASISGQSHVVDVSLQNIIVERFIPQERSKLPGTLRLPMNFAKALRSGITSAENRGRDAFSVDSLLHLHSICAQGLSDLAPAGCFRTKQTWIRGHRIELARFVPPPPSYVEKCVSELIEFLNASERRADVMPLVVRTGLAAAQLKAIQPFGVTGSDILVRILIPMMAVAEGMPPVLMGRFFSRYGQEYLDAQIEQHLTGSWSNWLTFFLDGYTESVSELSAIVAGLRALKNSWVFAVSDLRADSGVHKVVNSLLAHPVLTVQSLQARLDMSFQTANNAVAALVEKEILIPLHDSRRNRVFLAHGVVDVLENECTAVDIKEASRSFSQAPRLGDTAEQDVVQRLQVKSSTLERHS